MNHIIDPTNGNRVSLFSSQGKALLKQYVKLYQKGGAAPPLPEAAPPPLPEAASYTSSPLKYELKFEELEKKWPDWMGTNNIVSDFMGTNNKRYFLNTLRDLLRIRDNLKNLKTITKKYIIKGTVNEQMFNFNWNEQKKLWEFMMETLRGLIRENAEVHYFGLRPVKEEEQMKFFHYIVDLFQLNDVFKDNKFPE